MSWFFNAFLGNDSPSLTADGERGFHVLKVGDNSPSLEAGLQPYFDFIVGINGHRVADTEGAICGDIENFKQQIIHCGPEVLLSVWSAKGQMVREVTIPTVNSSDLGLWLQWAPLSTTFNVWHILDVARRSPAEEAGLIGYEDYVIGTPEGVLRGESALGEIVEAHMNHPLKLHVYSHAHDLVRVAVITPRRGWGGEGLLGCGVGYGLLHRIPAPPTEYVEGPGETLFAEPDADQGDFFTPGQISESFASHPRHKKRHEKSGAIQEYMQQQEKEGEEVENSEGARPPLGRLKTQEEAREEVEDLAATLHEVADTPVDASGPPMRKQAKTVDDIQIPQ